MWQQEKAALEVAKAEQGVEISADELVTLYQQVEGAAGGTSLELAAAAAVQVVKSEQLIVAAIEAVEGLPAHERPSLRKHIPEAVSSRTHARACTR